MCVHSIGSSLLVCLQGFYGRGCKLKCPCYHASTCSPFTGHCTQCEPGWMGKYCNESMWTIAHFTVVAPDLASQ